MFLNHPTREQRVYIKKVFHEDDDRLERDLKALKEWLKKEPHLPDTFDNDRLLSFLRYSKCSLENAKKKLDTFFTVRAAVPEFFANRDIDRPELQEILGLLRYAVMRKLTPKGCRITIIMAARTDFETPNIDNFFKLLLMFGELRLRYENVGVLGDVFIIDASVIVFKHYVNVNLLSVKKFFTCVRKAYPGRYDDIHLVNATSFFDFAMRKGSRLLEEKIRSRIHVHRSIDTLLDFFGRELLPNELGGTAGKLQEFVDLWMGVVEENKWWFEEQEHVKADESKRPGRPMDVGELFGCDGSFRQLTID